MFALQEENKKNKSTPINSFLINNNSSSNSRTYHLYHPNRTRLVYVLEPPHLAKYHQIICQPQKNQKESKQKLPIATTTTLNGGDSMQNKQFTINPFKQEINQNNNDNDNNNNNMNNNHSHQNATSYPIIAPTISVLPNSNANERTENSNIRYGEFFMLNGNRPVVFDWTTVKPDTSDFATRSSLLTYFNSANFSIKISRICDTVDNNKKTYKVKLYTVMSQTNFF